MEKEEWVGFLNGLCLIYMYIHVYIYTHTVFQFYFKIYLAVPGLSCVMQDLIPGSGIEPGPPTLGA